MAYKISASAVNQKVGDELVVLNMENGTYFGLDEVGARMIDLLVEYGEILPVVDKIAEEYDAPKAQIQTDLEALLETLLENDLLTVDD